MKVALALMKDMGLVREQPRGQYRLIPALDDETLRTLALTYKHRHENDLSRLERMEVFAQTSLCRWRMLLQDFGEEPEWTHCHHCDNCDHPVV